VRRKTAIIVAAAVCAGCGTQAAGGGQRLSPADAATLPKTGQLWQLCPVPDVPRRFRERVSREARRRIGALIREVRQRPDALVTLEYQDSHTTETFTDTTTVRELAEEHLENPGMEGVPCQRKLMAELQAAVDGRAAPEVTNERAYTLDELVTGLKLDKHGAVYASPDGCSVQQLYFDRDEVDIARREPIRNNELIASPKRRIGVLVYRPDRRCRTGIARDLARLDG
jgi:hypothetical protein